jgi:hypothetical protein
MKVFLVAGARPDKKKDGMLFYNDARRWTQMKA